MRAWRHWRWHLDEVSAKINGITNYLWRAVEEVGEVIEGVVTTTLSLSAALKFLTKSTKRHARSETIVTDSLRSYGIVL
jgi:putative transposase